MSQSRFSIVLVGVSALLRRPLVSRLRPADGERSSWVVFAARGGRSDSGGRWAGWPSGSRLPLFGMRRFGVAAGRVDLRAPVSAFRHAPLRGCRSAGWPSGSRLPLLARTASELPSSGWPSGSPLPLFGMHRFGVTTRRVGASARRVGSSAFRFGDCRSVGWPSGSPLPLFGMHRFGVALGELVLLPSASEIAARRVGLRAHASGLPSASWFCRLPFRRLPLGGLAFGLTASAFRHAPLRRLPLGGLAFGLTASAFRHAPLRGCPRRVGLRAHDFRFRHAPLRSCPRRVDLRAHRFRFSARTDPHRRTAEARADGAHRHDTCFTSKHLSQHVNLPHRTP